MDRLEDSLLQRLDYLVEQGEETPDVEFKGPLDLTTEEHRDGLAKSLLAMANSGGGNVVVGVAVSGPKHLENTSPLPTHDDINNIVKSYADPPFHCNVHKIAANGTRCAVVVVPGGHTTPIRAKRDGPKHVKINRYYVRKPGPASEEARTPEEWNQLLQRCIRNRKDDMLDQFRAIMEGRRATGEPPEIDALKKWSDESTKRLFHRVTTELKGRNFYDLGYWTFSYRVTGDFQPPSLKNLKGLLDEVGRTRYTGWRPWMLFTRDAIAPQAIDKHIETWISDGDDREPGHADFWRASPHGLLFLLRGYQEDETAHVEKPGTFIDITVPIWRVGECLLHSARFAEALAGPDAGVHVLVRWTGLKGRKLRMWSAQDRYIFWHDELDAPGASGTDRAESSLKSQAKDIESQLPELVAKLTAPLYEAFGFWEPETTLIQNELRRMTKREY